jgi:hypothetical protein
MRTKHFDIEQRLDEIKKRLEDGTLSARELEKLKRELDHYAKGNLSEYPPENILKIDFQKRTLQ